MATIAVYAFACMLNGEANRYPIMVCEWLCNHWIIGTVAGLGVLLLVYKRVSGKSKKTVPKDVVLMHSFSRTSFAPSASPFALKLETYLRMAKIPYEVDGSSTFSKKSKIPWITLNDEDVTDSYFSIEHVKKHFEVDLDRKLTAEQKATARIIEKTMEENTFWATMVQDRMFECFDECMAIYEVSYVFKLVIKYYFLRVINKYRWGHGIGRHSSEEIRHIGAKDLRAISVLLGDKPFFMGEEPTRIDATMFAFLALLIFGMPTAAPSYKLLHSELKNLVDFVYRMKEKFWPDWDDVLLKPKEKKIN
ncbi:Failed axon connections-like protein [Trichoplax sp. H2]|nr:Failed axon connections-like protein [Trichoplax sp. H2]|eukprot:RDD46515.1 Failed axon connections-like protein [Trichoplax sp. H2]